MKSTYLAIALSILAAPGLAAGLEVRGHEPIRMQVADCKNSFPCVLDLAGSQVLITGDVQFSIVSKSPIRALVTRSNPIRFNLRTEMDVVDAIAIPHRTNLTYTNEISGSGVTRIDGRYYSEGTLLEVWVDPRN